MGNAVLEDTLLADALTDSFENYHMGITAENIAMKYGISRKQQDEYAVISQNRAENAVDTSRFINEIVPIYKKALNGDTSFLNVITNTPFDVATSTVTFITSPSETPKALLLTNISFALCVV